MQEMKICRNCVQFTMHIDGVCQKCNTMRAKVYIASPFFNEKQVKDVEQIKALLRKYKLSFFSPKDDNLCDPNASETRRKDCFDKNLSEIENCELIIVNTEGKDTGSLIELGFSIKCKKPIIAFCQGVDKINLMIAQSCYATATTWEELDMAVQSFINQKPRKGFEGVVE